MQPKTRVMVVDDDETQVNLLFLILSKSGYEVLKASSGQDAWDKMKASPPDLVISDVEMAGMDGFQLATMMNMDIVLRSVPVILMSGRRVTPQDQASGLGLGSDDYIVKPFQAKELEARVKAVLRRREIGLDANPLTRLPGNSSILRLIEQRIVRQDPFSVLYADLNHFKAYNDVYGFFKGDEVIRFTAQVLLSAVQAMSGNRDFVGHVGGDDFVIVSVPERTVPLCEAVIRDFDKGVVNFYTPEDRAQGGIKCTDRNGKPAEFPIMGVAIGVVTNERRKIIQVGQVSQIGAEMKHYAKTMGGSRYVIDRRKD